jgi:putative copper export protein
VSLILLWLDVLAAMTWIGGMLLIVLVLVPVTRRLDGPARRMQFVQATGRRFRTVGGSRLRGLGVIGLLTEGGAITDRITWRWRRGNPLPGTRARPRYRVRPGDPAGR